MTAPTTMKFSEFVITMEDPNAPGSYIRPCGLTSKSLNRSSNMSESTVPDCEDESAPAEIQRGVVSKDWTIEGSFTIDIDDFDDWEDQYDNGVFNVKITRPNTGSGNVIYSGAAILSDFKVSSEFGSRAATGTLTLTGASKLTKAVVSGS